MKDVPDVGRLIPEGEAARRDAIHVAVAPVEAAECMNPGDRIGLDKEGKAIMILDAQDGEVLGIVDPYLKYMVNQGERFYMFLLPGTITGLRHLWTHPAFDRRTQS